MASDIARLVDGLTWRAGATNDAIAETERLLKAKLPPEYVEFAKLTNGGEGFVGNAYAMLWGVDELASMNHVYEVEKYVPGLLLFGLEWRRRSVRFRHADPAMADCSGAVRRGGVGRDRANGHDVPCLPGTATQIE
jgi:hypothetical protein